MKLQFIINGTETTNNGLNVQAPERGEVWMRDQVFFLQQLHLDDYRVDKVSLT